MAKRKVTDEMLVIAKIETLIRECAATRVMCSEIGIKVSRMQEPIQFMCRDLKSIADMVRPGNPLPSVPDKGQMGWHRPASRDDIPGLRDELNRLAHSESAAVIGLRQLADSTQKVLEQLERRVAAVERAQRDNIAGPGISTSVRGLLHESSNHRDELAGLTARVVSVEEAFAALKSRLRIA